MENEHSRGDGKTAGAGPKVSVIVPAHNAEPYLAQTLNSILAQTFGDYEVLVVDHASTDRTRDVVGGYAAREPRLRLIALDHDTGLPATSRNRGVEQARGELVAFLDADDLWHPRKLEEQVAAMDACPDAVLSFTRMRVFGRFGPLTRAFAVWPPQTMEDELARALTTGRNPISCSSVMIRRGVIERLGGFSEDPELRAVEDYDLWLRAASVGQLVLVPRILLAYRYHAMAVSRDARQDERVERVLASHRLQRGAMERPGRGRIAAVGRIARQLVRAGLLLTRERAERALRRPVPMLVFSRPDAGLNRRSASRG